MKTRLLAPPWCKPGLTEETIEAITLIEDDVWKEASIRFSAVRDAKIKTGKSAPKGMQRYLNEVFIERFTSTGWDGEAGYFYTGYLNLQQSKTKSLEAGCSKTDRL